LGPKIPAAFTDRGQLFQLEVVGGSQMLVFNNDLIIPLVESLGIKGVLFFDAGNAFRASKGIQFSGQDGLRMSVGAGIRWLSPIGPLRIEAGFPLNEYIGDETQTVQFSFGGPP
jgi:outer membrane protein insertion porin family